MRLTASREARSSRLILKGLLPVAMLLLASMFGYVEAQEVHTNGFGGITPFNNTGLTIFDDSLMRSSDYESDSLVLSAEFSILETNGNVRDFSLFDNDLSLTNSPIFQDSLFRTSLYVSGPDDSQWAYAPHSENLDMENSNVSLVWWGSLTYHNTFYGNVDILGKIETTVGFHYGLVLDGENEIIAAFRGAGGLGISTDLPSGGLIANRTYAIGITWEDNVSGTDVNVWLDGEWIYKDETPAVRLGDSGLDFRVGRSAHSGTEFWFNGTTDEVLVFKETLDNTTMQLLTTRQHDIVIRPGASTTTQGFEGLFFALPWLIVFGLLGWLGYLIFLAWREPFTRD